MQSSECLATACLLRLGFGIQSYLGRGPGHQAKMGPLTWVAASFLAHNPERCWEVLKPMGFLGFWHRVGAFEESRRWRPLPPTGGRGISHSPV